jgi:hypothetical protein
MRPFELPVDDVLGGKLNCDCLVASGGGEGPFWCDLELDVKKLVHLEIRLEGFTEFALADEFRLSSWIVSLSIRVIFLNHRVLFLPSSFNMNEQFFIGFVRYFRSSLDYDPIGSRT